MKKKFMILSTLIFGLIIGLYNIDGNEVKAETTNKCQTYTNYYLLLAANGPDDFIANFENSNQYTIGPFEKDFALGLLKAENKIYESGMVELDHNTVDNGIQSMSLETYHELFMEMGVNEAIVKDTNYYIRSEDHVNTDDENIIYNYAIPKEYSKFESLVPNNVATSVSTKSVGSNAISLAVTRTWQKSGYDWSSVEDDDQIYSPAVYYVQYEVCTHNVNAELIDKDTGDLIDSKVVKENLSVGATYEYTCPTDVEGYVLSTLDKTSFNGKIENEDVTLQCYYTKTQEPKDYTLTINFTDTNDCSDSTKIKDSENYTYTEGENVTYKIPEIENSKFVYDFSEIGSVSPNFSPKPTVNKDNEVVFKMPAKNTSICLVYIKNAKTGTGWIYFAWIIALLSLGYSGWYFVKYYKNRNNEI